MKQSKIYVKKCWLSGISFLTLLLLLNTSAFPQEEEPDNRPIRPPFETTNLVDNQTTVNLYKGAFQVEISHRFAKIETIDDLFGIYGGANTRLSVDYGITDKIMVGFGTTSYRKLQDIQWKYSILTQTRSGSMPLSLSYHGNMVLDARADEYFGSPDTYRFIHRFSYLHQLIVSRKFGEKVSMQVIPSFVYFNAVEDGYKNANYAVSFGGRAMVLGMNSIILEYDQPLNPSEEHDVKPNLALGLEIGTSTHAFRVFASNYNHIIKQHNIVYNTNDIAEGEIHFGFNISIRF